MEDIIKNVLGGSDASYNGPAKRKIALFWEQVEKLKNEKELKPTSTQSMENFLKMTKSADPAYNTSFMEEELKAWKEKCPTKTKSEMANEAQYEKRKLETVNDMKKMEEEKLLEKAIQGTKMTITTLELDEAQSRIDSYAQLSDNVLQFDLSIHKGSLDTLKTYIDRGELNAINEVLDQIKAQLKESIRPDNFYASYEELRLRQLHWDLLRKVYGDFNYETIYNKIGNTLSEIGGKDAIEKMAEQNNSQKIASIKMPVAVMSDPEVEAAVLKAFDIKYKDTFKSAGALKVVILQFDWYVERNDITGIVTGRNKPCALAYKGQDGKCYLLDGSIYAYQDFIGNAFAEVQVIYRGYGSQEMLFENV